MIVVEQIRGFARVLQRQYDPWPYLHCAGSKLLGRGNPPPTRQAAGGEELQQINSQREAISALTNLQITQRAVELRRRVANGASLEEVLVELFALAREAARRMTGLLAYDCQILAGLALCRGTVAEMATGEGKTLVAVFPAALHALRGEGVHLATVNSYLAERDHAFTRPVFELLGLRSALLPERAAPHLKERAYQADITYGVGSEFGFDYLRDQLVLFKQPRPRLGDGLRQGLLGEKPAVAGLMQRKLAFAIIDEMDSILIDEALTPLIISGAKGVLPEAEAAVYHIAREMAGQLEAERDFSVEAGRRSIEWIEQGLERIHQTPKAFPWERLQRPWADYVANALKARLFFQRDVHYIVAEEKVVLVDEFTGRAFADRSWREGMHQAVEAKENLPVTAENLALASISRQRFYRMYSKICGMTGTALEAAGELWRVYRCEVSPIPLNHPSRLELLPARVFRTWEEKVTAAVADIVRRHRKGQPVLVGTRTIQSSEEMAARLDAAGLSYRLLNAKQDQEEAAIIGAAGEKGAITIATNMAGRGAHIGLAAGVAELGGLHIVGMERHESKRVDRQLMGRAGRQGNPGSGQMFLSAEDFLLRNYAPEQAMLLQAMTAEAGGELPGKVAGVFDRVQMSVEKLLCRQRTALIAHDHWMDQSKERII